MKTTIMIHEQRRRAGRSAASAKVLALLVLAMSLWATPSQAREYTKEEPLIYEDVWDLWPYSFLNENGQPDGFDVDLLRLLLQELNIPYVIKMTASQNALNDLKNGRSDLMMGLAVGYHDEYGKYGRNSVTLFTQSVLSPKGHPTQIRSFRDLASHKVIVNDSSLCHHQMLDYGWGHNAIPTRNVQETILEMSTKEEGELIWNTLSLKWLLNKYQIDNLELSPINMTHGEFKFMSNDEELLNKLDSVFTLLNSADRLTPLQNKWFYPERQEKEIPEWVWWTCGGVAVLVLILLFYSLSYRMQARRITSENNRRNRRLALILETSGVRMWTYDIQSKMFTWRNEYGQPAYLYTIEEFSQRYSPEDFLRLTDAMKKLSSLLPKEGGEEEEITMNIKAKDTREGGDTEVHDFVIVLSVLRRDEKNNPIELIGTKKDVTEKRNLERKAHERILRYWAIFDTPMVGIMLFDRQGHMTNINTKACEMFCCNRENILAESPTYNDLFDIDVPIEEADGFHATQVVNLDKIAYEERKVHSVKRSGVLFHEYRLLTVYDETDQLLGIFAVSIDRTYVASSLEEQTVSIKKLENMKSQESEYIETIDDFIRNGDTRIVSYSPTQHVLTIYNAVNQVQHALTQTRLMTLVDDRMTNKAIRLVSNMDDRTQTPIEADIRTTLRVRGSLTLHVYLYLLPQVDKNEEVTEYLGILRDISELKASEIQLAKVEAKTQEVEDTKTAFMRNMMQEIRQPMNNVIDGAAQLTPERDVERELPITRAIMENADHLTHIINNILYLSRLEAHMVEIQKKPTDFAEIFESSCQNGWSKNEEAGVRYIVENPYEQLVIDIDAEHLGNIISQLTLNAAQHTHSGVIRARYDYIGRRLMISIDDTGDGIAPDRLHQLNGQLEAGTHTSNGLGLPICKELIKQMGGNLEINSELGLGTTVWITLPCPATAIKRKKIQ